MEHSLLRLNLVAFAKTSVFKITLITVRNTLIAGHNFSKQKTQN